MIVFCFDQVSLPNLVTVDPGSTEWKQLDHIWPRVTQFRLLRYCRDQKIDYNICTVGDAPLGSFYPIGIGYFDHECDYIQLLTPVLLKKVQQGIIRLLFYYHEGDNPVDIKTRLDKLHQQHNLINSYIFVSANSAADHLDNFIYFPDHESFFGTLNNKQQAAHMLTNREYEFTLLNRTHKWWRAVCTSDLLFNRVLDCSLWSYNIDCSTDEKISDCPIAVGVLAGWKDRAEQFVSGSPYNCDGFTSGEQNNHTTVNTDLYTNSYFNIVTETLFHIDRSNGTFITEKTFKPIKFGQPFVMVAPAGTLAELRNLGYRTFDSVIDNHYDSIENNTERWIAIRKLLSSMKKYGVDKLFWQCKEDILWNQQMFVSRANTSVNRLLEKILCQI